MWNIICRYHACIILDNYYSIYKNDTIIWVYELYSVMCKWFDTSMSWLRKRKHQRQGRVIHGEAAAHPPHPQDVVSMGLWPSGQLTPPWLEQKDIGINKDALKGLPGQGVHPVLSPPAPAHPPAVSERTKRHHGPEAGPPWSACSTRRSLGKETPSPGVAAPNYDVTLIVTRPVGASRPLLSSLCHGSSCLSSFHSVATQWTLVPLDARPGIYQWESGSLLTVCELSQVE